MRFFYADDQARPVGPLTTDEVRALVRSGSLHAKSPLIAEGAPTWSTVDTLIARSDEGPAPYGPPPGWNGFRNGQPQSPAAPLLSLRTNVDRAIVFGSIAAALSMLLPWGSVFGASVSGLSLAGHAPVLWLEPITFAAIVVTHQRFMRARPVERLLAMRYVLAASVAWLAIGLAVIAVGASLISSAGAGLYTAVAGSGAVAYGSLSDIREQINAIAK